MSTETLGPNHALPPTKRRPSCVEGRDHADHVVGHVAVGPIVRRQRGGGAQAQPGPTAHPTPSPGEGEGARPTSPALGRRQSSWAGQRVVVTDTGVADIGATITKQRALQITRAAVVGVQAAKPHTRASASSAGVTHASLALPGVPHSSLALSRIAGRIGGAAISGAGRAFAWTLTPVSRRLAIARITSIGRRCSRVRHARVAAGRLSGR